MMLNNLHATLRYLVRVDGVLEHGLDTRGSRLSLFQVSRGFHRKKLNLISRATTHHRAGPRGLYDSLRPFDLALYERSAVGSALRPGRPFLPRTLHEGTTDVPVSDPRERDPSF